MTSKKSIGNLFTRFIRDERGVAAVEAAFILPFLAILWVGMITLIDMQNATTQVGKVTGTVADIMTQMTRVDAATIDCAFDASDALLNSSQVGNLEMYVVGVNINGDGTNSVAWARGHKLNFTPLPSVGQPYANFPAELVQSDQFIVIAHAQLKHEPLFGKEFLNDGKAKYEYSNFYVPRASRTIDCTDCVELSAVNDLPCPQGL